MTEFPTTDDIAVVFTAVAVHFAEVEPAGALHPDALLATICGEAYKLLDCTFGGRTAALSCAVLQAAPGIPDGMLRSEYAALLVDMIPRLDQPEDAGSWAPTPLVPTIPSPRRESK